MEFNIDLNIEAGTSAIHLACMYGHTELVQMLIQNSVEFNIDLNTKDQNGWTWTAFHFACFYGRAQIVDNIIKIKDRFKIDVKAKTNIGRTGFQLAEIEKNHDVINLIKRKMPSLADLYLPDSKRRKLRLQVLSKLC